MPDPAHLHLLSLAATADEITLTAQTCGDTAPCPLCGQPSPRVHSRYRRILADLPWHGIPARVLLWSRRFFCDTRDCSRRIFTERLPDVTAPYAHRTAPLHAWFTHVAFALGGEAGARLLHMLGVTISGDTLLAHIRAFVPSILTTPTVLSVDDFALRRGRTYGSMLVGVERHRVLDLLPDRSGSTFAACLETHPGAEIISRDRSGAYAEGARREAPQAVQVADRFHLLRNLRAAVLRIFKRHTKRIAQVSVSRSAPMALTRLRLDREAARKRTHNEMQARFEAVQQLAAQGMSCSAIARAFGLHRHTVQKYLASDTAAEQRHTTRKTSALTPYQGYVLERWQGGCRNARQLWREIVTQGYPGAYENVVRLTGYLRKQAERGQPVPRAPAGLTPMGATGITLMRPGKRSADEHQMLAQVSGLHADLAATVALFARFAALLRDRNAQESAAQLDQWMVDAASSEIAEMRAFATKLRQDRDAVVAALTLPYSQGQTEGRVNKLKLLKRAMYGRAKFDLLRQRVLYAAN